MEYIKPSQGSNQYKKKYLTKHEKTFMYWFLFITLVWGYTYSFHAFHNALNNEGKYVSPLPSKAYASEAITPTPTQRQLIDREIQEVWGKEAGKFNKLLDCENYSRDPRITNINNDEWHSKDVGIAQINNHWQGVSNESFLTDYTINIRMAHNIYIRDGHSFKLWTCGRKLGI